MTDTMHAFDLYAPASLDEAAELLERHGDDAWLVAGGKDSFDWFKDRHKTPKAVVDISGLEALRGIADRGDHVAIGAAATLTEIEENALVRDRYALLAEAAGKVASPQIRNAGTIGGNVAQDTRCTYYRDGFPCYRAGGDACYANTPTAMNREHALFGASRCVAVTPSDMAAALVALDARMAVSRRGRERTVAAEDFFIGPEVDITRMTVLEPGDILTEVRLPAAWAGARHYFEKVADREAWDFALVSIAMAARVEDGRVADARIACGGVACTPRRLTDVEALAKGERPGAELETLVRRIAARGARPLNYNHFKVPLMANLAARAVRSLA